MEAKLYVGNLSYETTEQGLRELFMQAGNVVSVALIKEPGTKPLSDGPSYQRHWSAAAAIGSGEA